MDKQPETGPILERWNLAEAEDTFRVIRSEGRLIAKVFTMFPDGAPNARLIAAAPRMLELVRTIAMLGDVENADERAMLAERYAADAIKLVRDLHGEGQ